MRRPLLLAGVTILGLGALALGTRWWLERSATALMEELARALAPRATLTWRTTSVDLSGTLSAQGLTLAPSDGGPAATVTDLRFDFGGGVALLTAIVPWSHGRYPSRLRIALLGIRLPLPGPAPASEPSAVLGLEALDVIPCGGLDHGDALRALGAQSVVLDAEVGWTFEPSRRRLVLEGQVRGRDLADLALQLELEARDDTAGLETYFAARPVLRSGELTLTERGWFARTGALCAARSGLERDAWIAAHVDAIQHLLAASALAMSPSLREGYLAFRTAPARIRVAFDNSALRGADELLRRSPEEIAALLDLKVDFNDQPALDARLELAGAQRLMALPPLADASSLAQGRETLVEPSVRNLLQPSLGAPPRSPVIKPTPAKRASTARPTLPGATTLTPSRPHGVVGAVLAWDALGRERGNRIVVRMRDGRELDGVLRDVSPWRLTLERKVSGGVAVLPLARDDIVRVNLGR